MVVWLCPECKEGKAKNCIGWTFDDNDREVVCGGTASEFRIVWSQRAGRMAGLRVEHTPVFASVDAAETVRRCLRSGDLCEVVAA